MLIYGSSLSPTPTFGLLRLYEICLSIVKLNPTPLIHVVDDGLDRRIALYHRKLVVYRVPAGSFQNYPILCVKF
jgi:hypothetical protein